ncbi:MAG TPA: Ig-like domain-containing protein [Gaiellaceae bacterium]|nr:Ig-like domain-containing protein [Gaiellaceae bacterium]
MKARVSRGALVGAVLVALIALVVGGGANAATPSAGAIGPASGSSTAWDFAPVGPGVSSGGTIESVCAPVYCDSYQLTVSLPQPDDQFYLTHKATLHIDYTWNSTGPDDMDVFAFAPDGTESGPGNPDALSTGPGQEVLDIANPGSGVWTIESFVGTSDEPTIAHATATLTYQDIPAPPNPTLSGSAPRFSDASPPHGYQSTDVLKRQNAGEPSLGVDWKTGNAMYMAGTQISKISFDDSVSPPKATWTDVTPPQQSVVNEDAILFTDPILGRTFTEGLLVAGSNGGTTTDDGATWSPTTFPEPHGPDHETVGAGPYHTPAPLTAGSSGYPNAVYYCSQDILVAAGAFCGRSDDAGLTYNPSSNLFGITSPCASIHGHVKVSPDGTVYVPQNRCTRSDGVVGQGMAVSSDNGGTWSYSVVPDSTAKPSGAGSDPSVGIGAGNTVYYGYEAGDGHPRIAVSHDHGQTWSASVDVGTSYGIQNTKFPEVVAGDDNRAAFAFLGTTAAGNDQAAAFPGVWYLYVAYTYDGGQTWTTVNATPGDPVQRGCIWNGGGSNACRNLLDFNDASVDKQGRVLVAYTDGCANFDFTYQSLTGAVHGPSQCDTNPNSYANTDKANFDALVRQSCGEGLFKAYDPGFTAGCPAPRVVSVHPVDGATGVPVSTMVTATFDEPLASATLTLADSGGHAINGRAACNSPCTTVTFTPSARLKHGTTYTAQTTGTNSSGTGSLTWSFTTKK